MGNDTVSKMASRESRLPNPLVKMVRFFKRQSTRGRTSCITGSWFQLRWYQVREIGYDPERSTQMSTASKERRRESVEGMTISAHKVGVAIAMVLHL